MATFFGEVIYPSSRAFFDDYDDSDIENDEQDSTSEKTKIDLIIHSDSLLQEYRALIISDGQAATAFTRNYMLKNSDKVIAEFAQKKENESVSDVVIVKPKIETSTKLFLLSNNCLLLEVSPSISVAVANELTLQLTPWLQKCKEVLILTSHHISKFRCDSINDLPSAFVRALSTSFYPFPDTIKHLEQPNFISDLPASILSWCECQRKLGLMLVLYSDLPYLDSVTLNPLLKGFSQAGLSSFILNNHSTVVNSGNTLKDMDKTFMYM